MSHPAFSPVGEGPALGEPFLLLCRSEHRRQLEVLRDSSLLTWQDSSELDGVYDEWIEYRECRVLTPNWDDVPRRGQNFVVRGAHTA